MPLPAGVGAVLLDIEGTTTALSFVHDVLFPYARERLEAACARAARDPRFAEALALLRREHAGETAADVPAFGAGPPYAAWLMERDRKSTGLKALQGLIWESGYRGGALSAPLFADVPGALVAWRRAGMRLGVFSSGSVHAQRLLFAHTEHGDLTGFFELWADTTTGSKREAGSYAAIAARFGLSPARILFLSDAVGELDAARAAGMATGLLTRPGNPPVDPGPHTVHPDFTTLL